MSRARARRSRDRAPLPHAPRADEVELIFNYVCIYDVRSLIARRRRERLGPFEKLRERRVGGSPSAVSSTPTDRAPGAATIAMYRTSTYEVPRPDPPAGGWRHRNKTRPALAPSVGPRRPLCVCPEQMGRRIRDPCSCSGCAGPRAAASAWLPGAVPASRPHTAPAVSCELGQPRRLVIRHENIYTYFAETVFSKLSYFHLL